jgi:hypothetical protein
MLRAVTPPDEFVEMSEPLKCAELVARLIGKRVEGIAQDQNESLVSRTRCGTE